MTTKLVHTPLDLSIGSAILPRDRRYRFTNLLYYQPMQPATRTFHATAPGAALTVNVSRGGLCVLTSDPLAPRQVLRIWVPTPVVEVATPTLAEVRWMRHLRSDPLEVYAVGLRYLF